jgi:hypothetical protein
MIHNYIHIIIIFVLSVFYLYETMPVFSPGPKDSFVLNFPSLTTQNKELGDLMESGCISSAISHRKRFLETLGTNVAVKQHWLGYSE